MSEAAPPDETPAPASVAGVPAPPEVRRGASGLLWSVATLTVLAFLAATAALSWLVIEYPHQGGPGPDREVPMVITAHMTPGQLARRLEQDGIVQSALWFERYLCLQEGCDRLWRGAVSVNAALSPSQLALRVASLPGQRASVRVTLPEGFTRFAMAERLARYGVCSKQGFLRATEDPRVLEELGIDAPSAEGYLFPDTYELRYKGDPRNVVRLLVKTFWQRAHAAMDEHAATMGPVREQLNWGPHQWLTLASIVEKEARVPSERRVIAGVFLNRLLDPEFRPHRLQADPTVGYGCLLEPEAAPTCAEYDGTRIRPAMLRDPKNRYNTYRHDGLPPGPIANPGMGALRAALDPAKHGYYYFVATGGGRHTFSASLGEHNAAIRGER